MADWCSPRSRALQSLVCHSCSAPSLLEAQPNFPAVPEYIHCFDTHSKCQSRLTIEQIESVVGQIEKLGKSLPASIPEGNKNDKIYNIMSTANGSTLWETFNRRFDVLFGEDCRGPDGRLLHVRRGRLGIQKVSAYLSRVGHEDAMKPFYDIMMIKLERLQQELDVLWYDSNFRARSMSTNTCFPVAQNRVKLYPKRLVSSLWQTTSGRIWWKVHFMICLFSCGLLRRAIGP